MLLHLSMQREAHKEKKKMNADRVSPLFRSYQVIIFYSNNCNSRGRNELMKRVLLNLFFDYYLNLSLFASHFINSSSYLSASQIDNYNMSLPATKNN